MFKVTNSLRAIQKYDKVWHRGRGLFQMVMSLLQKDIVPNIVFSSIDASYRWTSLISPFYWHFEVVVHVDITFCVENMLFSEYTFWMTPKGDGQKVFS